MASREDWFKSLKQRLLFLENQCPLPNIPQQQPHMRRGLRGSSGGRGSDESENDNSGLAGAYMVSIRR